MRGRFSFRVVAAAGAVILAASAIEALRVLSALTAGGSALLWMTSGIAGLGAALCAVAAGLPKRVIDAASSRLANRWGAPPAISGRWLAICLFAAAGIFVLNIRLQVNVNPRLDDQGAFLQLARQIDDGGGLISLWQDLESGTFAEDNRNPLYPTLLSLAPQENSGRMLSRIIGCLAIGVCSAFVARRFSYLAACVFALLMSLNGALGEFSNAIVCESLMILLVGSAYFVVLRGRRTSASLRSVVVRLLLTAAILGLAYLTKATGLLYFAVFVPWLVWAGRPRLEPTAPAASGRAASPGVFGSPSPAPTDDEPEPALLPLAGTAHGRRLCMIAMAAAMTFVLVAQPLLMRNLRRFGHPFHNVNSLLLFADKYSDLERLLSQRLTTVQAARLYWQSHPVMEIARREISGLAWEAFIMLRSLGPMGLDDSRALFGAPLAAFALLSLWHDRRAACSLLIAWLFVTWVVFAWYVPIAAGDRFPIPLLAPVLAHAADGLVRFLTGRQQQPRTELKGPVFPAIP